MCWPRRQETGRIRQGCGKKLRSVFRWQLGRKTYTQEQQDWFAELIRAGHDEPWLKKLVEKPPPEAELEPWHAFYFRAWDLLQCDRQYFAFGGELPISFGALDRYARRYGIEGEAFERFLAFMSAMDDEWLNYRRQQDTPPEGS
ncbi:phage tail assembly chaperone [Mesorhizobium amorphae]